jgi:hypothetical protein
VRILIRTSKWAIWAQRLGRLAVPLLVLPIGLHHLGLIDSPSFSIAALVAAATAFFALLTALIALIRLWYSGDQGWGRALMGLFLGALCLMPFGYYGYLAWRYPPVTDIATVDRGELPLLFLPDTRAMPAPKLIPAAEQARIFPNATTRRYPLDPAQLFALAERLVAERGWDVRMRAAPGESGQNGRINARITTLAGWREEAVIRVSPDPQGAAIDMRSASINAWHDFSSNGERISEFMVALDGEVTRLLRDNPNANQPVAEEEEPPPPGVEGEAD